MKTFVISAVAAGFLMGCASTDTDLASTASGLTQIDDQPQKAVSGEGSLMPGAYDSRRMQTGQFTGRERTNDQVGQRPTLPREADPRELARSEEGLADGTGTLGQSGIGPDRAVSAETLMETSEPPFATGSPGGAATGTGTGAIAPTNSVPRPE